MPISALRKSPRSPAPEGWEWHLHHPCALTNGAPAVGISFNGTLWAQPSKPIPPQAVHAVMAEAARLGLRGWGPSEYCSSCEGEGVVDATDDHNDSSEVRCPACKGVGNPGPYPEAGDRIAVTPADDRVGMLGRLVRFDPDDVEIPYLVDLAGEGTAWVRGVTLALVSASACLKCRGSRRVFRAREPNPGSFNYGPIVSLCPACAGTGERQ